MERFISHKGLGKVEVLMSFQRTDNDFTDSGFQHLTTKSGRKVSFNSALKTFNDAKNATEFVNFSKV